MPSHDIIVIGASAGGVEALRSLVQVLPANLPAALFVVLHTEPGGTSVLPEVLNYRSALPAAHARVGEIIRHGRIYVAPPDYHLLIQPGHIQLSHGPRENRCRPAVDPMFRSAARAYRGRVIGLVLTGMLNDGAAGLMAVRAAGGVAIVQDPHDARAPSMPQAALAAAGADHVLPLAEIAPLLVKLATELNGEGRRIMSDTVDPIDDMSAVVKQFQAAQENGRRRGEVSIYTCPECGGSLWQVDEAKLDRFRFHVGHVCLAEQLLADQSEKLEAALWLAVRTFIDKANLARQMAISRRAQGMSLGVDRLEEEAQLAEQYAALIREHVLRVPPTPDAETSTNS